MVPAYPQDVCKHNMKAGGIDPAGWKAVAEDWGRWKEADRKSKQQGERLRED